MQSGTEVRCEKCRERLAGFVLLASESANCYNWDDPEKSYVVADGTEVVLTKDWRQHLRFSIGKRDTARWLKKHRALLSEMDGHITVHNLNNTKANLAYLCKTPEDIFRIEGPGAEAHIERDRVKILEHRLNVSERLLEESKRKVAAEELTGRINTLLFRFEKLGVDASRSKSLLSREPGGYINLSPDMAELVLEKLESLSNMTKRGCIEQNEPSELTPA